LLGLGHGAAEDDIFYFFGINLRHALERTLDRDGGEFIWTVARSVPLKARPTGVRTEEAMMTSLMAVPGSW